jgi:WD40 repeat protein
MWDIEAQKEYGPLDLGPKARIPVLSNDAVTLAYAPGDNTVRLCDRVTGHVRTVLRGHTAEVYQYLFSPDGTRVTTTADDGTLRVSSTYSSRPRMRARR